MNQFDDGLDEELDEEETDAVEKSEDEADGLGLDDDLAETNWDSEVENEE